MLRSTHPSLLRPLAGACMITAAAMLVPAAARAQTTPEVAMLNRLAPTVYLPGALTLRARSLPLRSDTVDGEQALLARIPAAPRSRPSVPYDAPAPRSPDGAQALLGRWDRSR